MSDTIITNQSFEDSLRALTTEEEYNAVIKYIENGGKQLAPSTMAAFFELFLNGCSIDEIHKLNKGFPIEAIHWARAKYQWDQKKEMYLMQLHSTVRDKLVKAQIETIGLITDLLSAANKKHGVKIKKFLQTGNEDDLEGALSVDSINSLLKVTEALQKLTGQDRIQKISKEEKVNINVQHNVNAVDVTPETASKILALLADSKRNTNNNNG